MHCQGIRMEENGLVGEKILFSQKKTSLEELDI